MKKMFFPIAGYRGVTIGPKGYRPALARTGWFARRVSPVSDQLSPEIPIKVDKGLDGGGTYQLPVNAVHHVGFLDIPEKSSAKIYDALNVKAGDPLRSAPFWSKYQKTQHPIVITSGELKAGALITAGFAAVSTAVCGGLKFRDRKGDESGPRVEANLALFAARKRQITIIFDVPESSPSISFIRSIVNYSAQSLVDAGAKVKIVRISSFNRGVIDFLKHNGEQALRLKIAAAPEYAVWKAAQNDILPVKTIRGRGGCD